MPGVFLNEYAVVRARATVQPSDDAWDLLNAWRAVERIGGVGPWVPPAR